MRPRLYKGKVDGKCPFRRGKKRKLRLCEQILYTFPKHFQRFIVISTLKEGPGRQGEVGEEEKGGGEKGVSNQVPTNQYTKLYSEYVI